MKNLILSVLLACLSVPVYAQTPITDSIKKIAEAPSNVKITCLSGYNVVNGEYICGTIRDKTLDRMTVIYGSLVATDLTLTMYMSGKGQFNEFNPLWEPLMDKPLAFGLTKGVINTALGVGVYKLPKKYRRPTMTVLILANATAVVLNSFHYLDKKNSGQLK